MMLRRESQISILHIEGKMGYLFHVFMAYLSALSVSVHGWHIVVVHYLDIFSLYCILHHIIERSLCYLTGNSFQFAIAFLFDNPVDMF